MDLKSLFKKNSKQSGEPKSYDSLDSEFERSESTVNHPHTSYEISRQDHDSLNLDSATLSEETKDDFNAGAFGKNNGSHPFESLMKKTEESKEDGFGFSSRIERGPMVPNEDHDYTTDGTAFNRSNEDDEVAETNTDNTVSPGSVNSRTTTNNADATTDSNFEAKIKKLPLLGNLAVKRQYQIAGGLAALGLASFMTGTFLYINNATEQGSSLESVSILQTDAQKSDSAFSGSVVGKQGAYARLSVEFPKMVQESEKLTKFIDRLPSDQKAQLKSVLQKDIDAMKLNVESVNKNSEFLKNTADRVNTISNQIGTLIEMIDRVGVLYIQLGATPTEMADIYYLKTLLQTISENTVQILLSDNVNPQTMPDLIKARKNFRKVLAEIYSGNPSKGIRAMPNGIPLYSYKQLASTWVYFSNVVDTVVTRGPDLIKIRTLGTENTQIVKELDKHLISIKNSLSGSDFGDLTLAKVLSIISLIVLLTGALLIFFINTFEKDNRSLLDKIENNRTQTSIFRLLNEMTPLQDGDLTKKTTVTEEITGAIADSINATVDSLASLVKKIKDTSFTMRQKTNEVNVISLEMLKSSEEQSTSLLATGNDVINVAKSIDKIAEKTISSAAIAQNSVNASEEGSQQVLASIGAMKQINNNMKETVHLMKTVSESSKQISDIVGVLSDIAEDTAILALNATVQAAKAGEAGKGFKIVADEIQELADSSGEKARTVGALISAVQTAIQAVENAVSKTTDEVTRGVELSEKAGESLNQITEVSYDLSSIVRGISEDATKNAAISRKVSENMEEILRKTEENKKSTQKTANSISEISEISNELGNSVQTFKVE